MFPAGEEEDEDFMTFGHNPNRCTEQDSSSDEDDDDGMFH